MSVSCTLESIACMSWDLPSVEPALRNSVRRRGGHVRASLFILTCKCVRNLCGPTEERTVARQAGKAASTAFMIAEYFLEVPGHPGTPGHPDTRTCGHAPTHPDARTSGHTRAHPGTPGLRRNRTFKHLGIGGTRTCGQPRAPGLPDDRAHPGTQTSGHLDFRAIGLPGTRAPWPHYSYKKPGREQLDTAPGREANGKLDGLETEARVLDGGPQRRSRWTWIVRCMRPGKGDDQHVLKSLRMGCCCGD